MANSPIFTPTWDLDYFSESSTFLYIGDVQIDEIVQLQYRCQQQKTPIYGYASQMYDKMAPGHLLVNGMFAVNFKEQGYLWAVLRRYFDIGANSQIWAKRNYRDPVETRKAKRLTDGKIKPGQGQKGSRPIVGSNGNMVSRATIERLVQGDATRKERYDFYQDLAGYSTFDVNNPKDKVFEDIMEAFEDEVWKTTDNDSLLSQARRIDDNTFDGFDMYLVFGDYATPGANHTVRKIVDVHLLSEGKAIQIDNGPVLESYEFTAKTIV
jgi:hypothetical protein